MSFRDTTTVMQIQVTAPAIFGAWVFGADGRSHQVNARSLQLEVDEQKLGLVRRIVDDATRALTSPRMGKDLYGNPIVAPIHRPYRLKAKLRPEFVAHFETLQREKLTFAFAWLVGIELHELTQCKVDAVNDATNELVIWGRLHRTTTPSISWSFPEESGSGSGSGSTPS